MPYGPTMAERRRRASSTERLLDPRSGQVSGGEWRFWDRDGRLWSGAEDARDRVDHLLADPTIVVVAQREHRFEWLDDVECRDGRDLDGLATFVLLRSNGDRLLLGLDDL